MDKKKFLSKIVIASILTGGINFLPVIPIFNASIFPTSIAHAEIKTYEGIDTAMSDFGEENATNVNTVKNMAKIRAEKMAKEKAAIFVGNFAGNLTEDDIATMTSNIAKVVDVQYQRLLYQAKDEQGNLFGKVGYMYEATVTLKIDTDGINEYIKRNAQEKTTLIEQNKNRQKTLDGIDKDFEDLRKNSANKTPEQINAELEKINNRISATQNNSSEEEKAQQMNSPMQFLQPVEIGGIGFPVQAPYHGYEVNGATNNNGESYFENSKWVGKPFYTYTKGIAQWGNGKDALYCDYSFKPYEDNKSFIKFGGKNNYIISTDTLYKNICRIDTNQGVTLYSIVRISGSEHINIIGRQKDGKWVSYIDSEILTNKYFDGKQSYKFHDGVHYGRPQFTNNAVIIPYQYQLQGKTAVKGEFRFKWDEVAQWFSVEKIVY